MKKMNWLAISAIAASVSLFSSCGPSEDAVGPEVKITSPADATTIWAEVGENITIKALLTAGDAELASYDVIYANNSIIDATEQESIDGEESSIEKTITIPVTVAGLVTIKLIDSDDLETSISFNIAIPTPLIDNGEATLGAAGNTTVGSYYSVSTKEVYKSADAEENVSKIDIVYDYLSEGTLKSPSESTKLKSVAGVRTTTFAKVTGVEFATATDENLDGVTIDSKSIGVAQGDVVAYKTADGDLGFIKIETLTTGTDGTAIIKVNVK